MFVCGQTFRICYMWTQLLSHIYELWKSASIIFPYTTKIITPQTCSLIGRCVLVNLHVIAVPFLQCKNGTASVDRVVCFVEVYGELVSTQCKVLRLV